MKKPTLTNMLDCISQARKTGYIINNDNTIEDTYYESKGHLLAINETTAQPATLAAELTTDNELCAFLPLLGYITKTSIYNNEKNRFEATAQDLDGKVYTLVSNG